MTYQSLTITRDDAAAAQAAQPQGPTKPLTTISVAPPLQGMDQGTLRLTHNGTEQRLGVTRLDVSAASRDGSILGTARDLNRSGVVGEITDDSIVTVQGMDMTVREAVRFGYLRRTGSAYVEGSRS